MLVNNIHIKEGLDAKKLINDMFKLCANRKFTKHRRHFSQLKIYNLEYKKWVPSNLSTKQIHIFLRKLCFSSAYTTYNNIIIFWYILAPTESVRQKKQSSQRHNIKSRKSCHGVMQKKLQHTDDWRRRKKFNFSLPLSFFSSFFFVFFPFEQKNLVSYRKSENEFT